MEKRSILSAIRTATLQDIDTSALKVQLVQLAEEEPVGSLLPTLFMEDITQEALAAQLANGWPSGALWSDEGALILGSHGMQTHMTKFIALLNRLWDGQSFLVHRKSRDDVIVQHRRLTLSIIYYFNGYWQNRVDYHAIVAF